MKPKGFSLIILILFLFSQAAYADFGEGIEFSGYLEKRGCYSIKESGDVQASEVLFRGEIRKVLDNALLFASADVMENEFNDENSKLHEAYIDYSIEAFNLRCGKQIIIWGNSDGLRITDNISPVDSSEFITRSFDETRMAVDAVNFSYNQINYSLNLLYIPVFKSAETPDEDSPWFIGNKSLSQNSKEEEPDKTFNNGEFGGKLNFYLPGFDFSLSYFRGFSDNPVFMLEKQGDKDYLLKKYKREQFFGATISKPFNDFVFRGETAFFKNLYLNSENLKNKPVRTDLIKWIIGTDYYPGSNLTLSFQVYGENILSNSDETAKDEFTNILTFSISKKLFREKLELSSMTYFNTGDNDSYINFSSKYEINNHIKISAGADFFSGSSDTGYGRYEDNSQVWFRLKYSF